MFALHKPIGPAAMERALLLRVQLEQDYLTLQEHAVDLLDLQSDYLVCDREQQGQMQVRKTWRDHYQKLFVLACEYGKRLEMKLETLKYQWQVSPMKSCVFQETPEVTALVEKLTARGAVTVQMRCASRASRAHRPVVSARDKVGHCWVVMEMARYQLISGVVKKVKYW